MDNKQKELLDTYLRKRKIANENGDNYSGSEIIYFLKNKIMTLEELDLDFYEGFARVKYEDNKYGFIDTEGNPFPNDGRTFMSVDYFRDGLARVKYDYKWGFIDTEGNAIPRDGKTFIYIKDFYDGIAVVKYDDYKWGFIDKEGNLIPKDGKTFMDIGNFKDGFASIYYGNGKWGFIDKEGNYYDENKTAIY
jgi:glutamine cyclotransferase